MSGHSVFVTGRKLAGAKPKKVSTTLPPAEHEELLSVINASERWIDPADFARQAIREKLERWKREHPLGARAGPPKGGER